MRSNVEKIFLICWNWCLSICIWVFFRLSFFFYEKVQEFWTADSRSSELLSDCIRRMPSFVILEHAYLSFIIWDRFVVNLDWHCDVLHYFMWFRKCCKCKELLGPINPMQVTVFIWVKGSSSIRWNKATWQSFWATHARVVAIDGDRSMQTSWYVCWQLIRGCDVIQIACSLH